MGGIVVGTPTRDHLELGHQRVREGPTTTTETETQTETERQKQRLDKIGPGALGPGSGTEAQFEFGARAWRVSCRTSFARDKYRDRAGPIQTGLNGM